MIVERRLDLARDFALVGGGALATAVAAQVSIPAYPVPFTLQTLAVLSSGLLLGARRGAAAQLSYLLMGAVGLPVFAEGKFGVQWLFGPTGGYLWSFVVAAAILGWVADRGVARKPLALMTGLLAANAAIFLLGAGWLSLGMGLAAAWTGGVVPFLLGNACQSIVAAVLASARRAQPSKS